MSIRPQDRTVASSRSGDDETQAADSSPAALPAGLEETQAAAPTAVGAMTEMEQTQAAAPSKVAQADHDPATADEGAVKKSTLT